MYIDQAYVTKQVSLVDKPAPRDFEQAALKKGLTRLLVQLWQHVLQIGIQILIHNR